ncbi:MAG: glycosyltransferase family 4 protein [Ruminococcus sp.]|uniref:glycosyltransferase family 4 protein n=1 Tax=Ruminococcus sp. TaxID=41978 RepID=UPI001B5C6540|nr:glycosyltransferase family 4 protein [Ruminococcus sp.]MBP5579343.1 glycosyltransferase family 4 protein [Ruminococcus sp.]
MKNKKEKIVMIGPVFPYKGGIAHYTGAMVKNLKKDFDVETVSYKMQYPKLLFRNEQKDFANDLFRIPETKYLINTANPINWLISAYKIKKMKPDRIIIQWWHPYFSPCYSCLSFLLRRIPRIFVCHNVFPHERFPMDRFLTKLALKRGSAYITHSEKEAADLKQITASPVCEAAVHPVYNAFKIKDMTKEQAKQETGIAPGRKMLLFFGFIREYKGLRHIINAMPEILKYDPDIELWVVGEFRCEKEEYLALIKKSGAEDRIRIVDGYIPDSGIEKYFAAADIVVLPYESATQSGIVQIAYGFEKPVVATNVGGLPEVVLDGKTGYIVPPKDPRALAEAVCRFFREDRAEEFAENVRKEAYKYSWDRMNEVVQRLTEKTGAHEG